jgi:hypothetical protein
MRFRPLAAVSVLALALAFRTESCCCSSVSAADVDYTPLQNATFINCEGVDARLPNGYFTIEDGLIAMFNEGDSRKEGMCIGSVRFCVEGSQDAETVETLGAEKMSNGDYLFETAAAYMLTSPLVPSTVTNDGRILSMRSWSQLDSAEQTRLKELYSKSIALGEPSKARLDDPSGVEVFAVAWLKDGGTIKYCVSPEGEVEFEKFGADGKAAEAASAPALASH